ncbi:hypothetical protein [Litoreibacter janthinus]|uniref:Uncharacterized protein n=1 Tax=Litoreibacter janthinus TaxID=670154 RepID=A0A1I6HND7_9RHOB|nr:hypothetical protein [Litoreibacter janthinus]SFR55898.1 hypothetical protein SAMN04488002_3191 [Litoreibacter janthinus]
MTKPKKQVLLKFCLLLALLAGYFGYLSYTYNVATGGAAAVLTWSFFVLCTPVADAGFLLDFPLRLLFGIRMVVSEVAVWAVAIGANVLMLIFGPSYYETTLLTQILHQILTQPFPYWGVIVLSGFGTFLSIRFGDELLDVIHHHDRAYFHSHHFKHEMILFVFFLFVIFGYYELIASVGLEAVLE